MRTRSTYDPFGWQLQELTDPELNPARRTELLDELLIAEAEECALGRRHLDHPSTANPPTLPRRKLSTSSMPR